MNELEILRKKSIGHLRDIFTKENNGEKPAIRWNRRTLARKILEKRKLKELDKEIDYYVDPANSRGAVVQKRNPKFEALAGKPGPEPALEEPSVTPEHIKDEGRGGPREGAGRTPGLTDDLARAQHVLKNEVPDPAYCFLIKKFFSGWQKLVKDVPGIALSDQEAELIGLPVTNLVGYYFPDFTITPVIEMWFGLYMSLDVVIGQRIALIKAVRSGSTNISRERAAKIMERISTMSEEQQQQIVTMLGIDTENNETEKAA